MAPHTPRSRCRARRRSARTTHLGLHTLTSDFSCADSPWKTRHKGVPQASGSVPVQCRSKTVIGSKVMKHRFMQGRSQ
ncbi:hypothetical protein J4732_07985 [Serratia marcescens]|uniref:Uncharacterized protein n=1 Tax=Serratia marcescens TaxID=615 RepID=A0A939NKR9_SERMA|nr:hypothetical protein [Serratia marcescens]